MQPGGCYCKLEKLLKEPKSKDIELPEEAKPTPRRKKNRRKWCRGKVGVVHKPEWVSDPDRNLNFATGTPRADPIYDYQTYVCQSCGKRLDYRSIHLACGKVHDKSWGYGYYYKDRITGDYVRKPHPCEEKAA